MTPRNLEVTALPEPDGSVGPGTTETWVVGRSKDGNAQFRLDQGAGLGNSHLTLLVELIGGTRVREYIDVAALTEEWVNAVVDEYAYVEPCDPGAHSWVRVGFADQYCEACGVELRHTADELDEEPEPPVAEHTDRVQDADIADKEAGL